MEGFLLPSGSGKVMVLASCIACLGWFRWWLMPSALMLFVFSGSMICASSLASILTFVYLWESSVPVKKRFHRRSIWMLATLVGLGAVLSMNSLEPPIHEHIAWVIFPMAVYVPIQVWMARNSGGGASWVPLILLVMANGVFTNQTPLGASWAFVTCFWLLVAWYRQLPQAILNLSLVLGVLMLGMMVLDQSTLASVFILLMAMQLGDKWIWGRGRCLLKVWSWGALAIGTTTLILRDVFVFPSEVPLHILPSFLSVILVWLSTQEVCRLCVSTSRCREILVTHMGSRIPLMFYVSLFLVGVNSLDYVFLVFAVLMSETSRLTKLRPVLESDILESPCRGEWAQWLLQKLRDDSKEAI